MKALIDRAFRMEQINGDGLCPTYLYRWTLLRFGKFFAVYLHKFVGDDWSLDLHDHPKRFWSIGLRGWYVEHTPCPHKRVWQAPWVRTFAADHIHRLSGPTPGHPCWTIVIVGRPVRAWGFWSGGVFRPWRQYVNSPTARARKACP